MRTNLPTTILLTALWALTGTAVAAGAASPAKRYVITDSGAVGDGQTLNTKAIQSVIDRCASSGGGVVVVPKGIFMSGALFFKPGVNLLVEKEGVLKGSTNGVNRSKMAKICPEISLYRPYRPGRTIACGHSRTATAMGMAERQPNGRAS